jgi:hypothetical protein
MMQATAGHGRIATLLFKSSRRTRTVAHPPPLDLARHQPVLAPERRP